MEDNNFYNVREFNYIVDYPVVDANIYATDIKDASLEYNEIKNKINDLDQLIERIDTKITESKDEQEYNKLVDERVYCINKLVMYKTLLNTKRDLIAKNSYKNIYVKTFLDNVKKYNENLEAINKMIRQYNYDIIYNEKSITDIILINKYKEYISRIINFNDERVKTNINTKILKLYYNRLSMIDSYYTNNIINSKLNNDGDYEKVDIDGFIFNTISTSDYDDNRVNNNGLKKGAETTTKNDIGNIDYIIYCDQMSGKVVRRHNMNKTHKIRRIRKTSKLDKIKKSLRKQSKKIISGLLIGAAMIGLSTFGVGFSKTNGNNGNEPSVVTTINKVDYSRQNVDNDIKPDEITIGTKVQADGEIYTKAIYAHNKENGMDATYSMTDEREVSLIYYENTNGDGYVVSEDNKDKIEDLKRLKYDVVAYCLNNDTHNINNEGWYNVDNVKVLSR